ncbi:hypothetical protein JCM33374_g4696 [Metschnikowia sp. JCM 33374]|nr:hypothetical protein JCM33374_g4696 [Metschnikowia sp. JCM 33374]
MRGNLILLEGLDRSGKSTQADILSSRLQAKLVKFPDRSTPIGTLINEYLTNSDFHLSDEAAHLLFSANRWELADELVKVLQSGTNVVMDRYVYSGIAYSLAKENSKSREWLYSPDKGLPKPDLTMFLTIPMAELAQRKNWGDERYEKTAFQEKVKQCFLSILSPEQDPSVVLVDVGNSSIEEVTEKLWGIIVERKLHVQSSLGLERLA